VGLGAHQPVVGPLIYSVDGVDVRGRVMAVPVQVRFYPALPPTFARVLAPEDYPTVFADRGRPSPHRLHDDALCLYYPWDPPELRWSASMGLLRLLEAAAEHLYFEQYWRDNRVWLGREAPHGVVA
jgi:hypothetical protein